MFLCDYMMYVYVCLSVFMCMRVSVCANVCKMCICVYILVYICMCFILMKGTERKTGSLEHYNKQCVENEGLVPGNGCWKSTLRK